MTTGPSGSGTLLINVNGTNFPDFNASSLPTQIAIAAAQDIPTDKIKVNTITAVGSNAKFANNTLFIKRTPQGGPGTITLSVQYAFQLAGTFQVGTPAASPASDWGAQRTSSASINAAAPGATSVVSLKITPKNNGTQFTAADGQFDFVVQSNNGVEKLPFSAQLRIVDVLPLNRKYRSFLHYISEG